MTQKSCAVGMRNAKPGNHLNVHGHISNSFKLSRGVRQGCPLSPLLYVLVADVLACNIRSNGVISGLTLPSSPCSLPAVFAYADDTTLVVSSLPGSLAVFDVYSLYERVSGAKLNYGKCEGCGWDLGTVALTHRSTLLGRL